jgi:hypothetical protein
MIQKRGIDSALRLKELRLKRGPFNFQLRLIADLRSRIAANDAERAAEVAKHETWLDARTPSQKAYDERRQAESLAQMKAFEASPAFQQIFYLGKP